MDYLKHNCKLEYDIFPKMVFVQMKCFLINYIYARTSINHEFFIYTKHTNVYITNIFSIKFIVTNRTQIQIFIVFTTTIRFNIIYTITKGGIRFIKTNSICLMFIWTSIITITRILFRLTKFSINLLMFT